MGGYTVWPGGSGRTESSADAPWRRWADAPRRAAAAALSGGCQTVPVTTFDCADPVARRAGLEAAGRQTASGELVVLPTDTVYGIGADAFNSAAVQKLLATKGRGPDMPVPVLVGAWGGRGGGGAPAPPGAGHERNGGRAPAAAQGHRQRHRG